MTVSFSNAGLGPKRPVPTASPDQLDELSVALLVPLRDPGAHKQMHGRLVIVAGSLDYLGAALLTAMAGVRAGAGLVYLAVPASLQPLVAGRIPEVITMGLTEDGSSAVDVAAAAREVAAQRPDGLVIGPGLRAGPTTQALVMAVLGEDGPPAVVDAEALNVLAGVDGWWHRLRRSAALTPHAGEFARLDGASVGPEDDERLARAQAAAGRWGQVVVLKGARTVIAAPSGRVSRAPFAEPVLATAGTGDVLAGIIGALVAQGLTPFDAAQLGVWMHGAAAARWREDRGDAGLAASDLPALLPSVRRDLVALRERQVADPDGHRR